MSKSHRAFVFDEAGFRRELAPLLQRNDSAGLQHFLHDHQAQLRNPETGAPLTDDDDHSAPEVALTAFYDPATDIGLGSAAEKLRFALIDLYPEGRVFVGGGQLPGIAGEFQSAEYVAGSVPLLEQLRHDHPQQRAVIDPVLHLLQTAAAAGKGLYIAP